MNYEHIPHWLLQTSALVAAGLSLASIDRAQGQSVESVDDFEISVHQLDDGFARHKHMPDKAAVDAPDAVLDGPKDQELGVRQAIKLGLERTLEVAFPIGRERRQLLAQSYRNPLMAALSESSVAEISAHYKADQAIYCQRRKYRFIHFAIELPNVDNAVTTDIGAYIQTAVALENFTVWQNCAGLAYVPMDRIAAAEAREQPILMALGKLQDDEFARISAADGFVLFLHWSADEAISEQKVFRAIRRLFADQWRIDAAIAELESLRERADSEIALDPGTNTDFAA